MSRTTSNIEGLFLPQTSDDFFTYPVDSLEFSIENNGVIGDKRHNGSYRYADVRAGSYAKKQDLLVNRQGVSVVIGTDLDYIAEELSLDPDLIMEGTNDDSLTPQLASRRFLAQCLGANILLDEVRFEELEPRHPFSVLDFGPYDEENGKFTSATVQVTRPNGPCIWPGKKIEEHYPGDEPNLAKRFVTSAQGRRGFVGSVIKAGMMTKNQSVSFVAFGD